MTAPNFDPMPEGFFAPLDSYADDRDARAEPVKSAPVNNPAAVEPISFCAEGPQPLMREIPPGEAYPIEALGPLRAAVEAVQGRPLPPSLSLPHRRWPSLRWRCRAFVTWRRWAAIARCRSMS